MDKIEIIRRGEIHPELKTDKKIIEDALNQINDERQVIVHCYFKVKLSGYMVRIWRSTYLRDKGSAHKSKLLIVHNITTYPTWMSTNLGETFSFTLVFEGLPKDCTSFDLLEDIPQGGGFYSRLIDRNKTDVYSVEVFG